MAKSILEASSNQDTNCKPMPCGVVEFVATDAEPGSAEKLAILARRIRQGLPLWHPQDRHMEDILMARVRRAMANAERQQAVGNLCSAADE